MITLSQLEYVVAVALHRNFGQAADACHISQPSLSAQILKAEREAGYAFFDRLKRPVSVTEKGREFVAQAKLVLHEHERLRDLAHAGSDALQGTLRIGVIPTLAPYLVPLFIRRFAQKCPSVRLSIDELPTALLVRGLRDGQLDAAIAATPLQESGIEERPLFYEPFSLYARSGDALLRQARIALGDLKRDDIWLLSDGHCLRHQVSRLCSGRRNHPGLSNISFEGGTLETLRQSIRHNGGATLVPELFVRHLSDDERRACVRPFKMPAPSRQISLLRPLRSWKSNLLAALESSITASLPVGLIRKADRRVMPVRRVTAGASN